MKNFMSHIGKAIEKLDHGENGTKGNVEVKGDRWFHLNLGLADAP
jgi:hypothetical protein